MSILFNNQYVNECFGNNVKFKCLLASNIYLSFSKLFREKLKRAYCKVKVLFLSFSFFKKTGIVLTYLILITRLVFLSIFHHRQFSII